MVQTVQTFPRGWRVLVQLPALGLREMDWAAFDKDQNGTALGEVLELTLDGDGWWLVVLIHGGLMGFNRI